MLREDILCSSALRLKGEDSQLDMLVEECSELILSIAQYRRGRVDFSDVLKEMADVSIVSRQFELSNIEFNAIKEEKLDKFERYVKDFHSESKSLPEDNVDVVGCVAGFPEPVKLFRNGGTWCLSDHYGHSVSEESVKYWAYN
ncbi:hypothetical protein [Aeromonas phage vB_ AhaP_PT2]|uniref:Uncharacterized protein n=1 Tax=Aeromonas phage vB_ AhaP_PT2 TaxID=2924715 RepID=A0AC61TT55_9CAUD|nr:hypothetical protein [Aeromonas phage vB_ AhaP_PT2]